MTTKRERYLRYLSKQVIFEVDPREYRDLCEIMQSFEFEIWLVPNDDNRIKDGLDVRVQWMMPQDLSGLQGPVSFLEVLVGISRRFQFMIGEGTAVGWAWQLLVNLGLDRYRGELSQYRTKKVLDILETVIWRTYERDGAGGFFPLTHPEQDQRRVEIWYQMSAYVMEIM